MSPRTATARGKLLAAAFDLIRAQGLAATSVDQLCERAGVTKGAFFHHFATKEALAVAAAQEWGATTGAFFAANGYHQQRDPLERIFAYLDLRASLIEGGPAAYSCVAGTMVQEAFATSPAVRDACGTMFFEHAATLESDIQAAIDRHAPGLQVTARSLAVHILVVLHGAFVVSKAGDDPQIVLDSIEHLRRYLRQLFTAEANHPKEKES